MWATDRPRAGVYPHVWHCSDGCDWSIASTSLWGMVRSIILHFATNHPAIYGEDD